MYLTATTFFATLTGMSPVGAAVPAGELVRFAAAGLSPMDVLRSATTVPAEYLGREGDLGAVRVGHLADLVLLGADPLADIENVRRIDAVVIGGTVLDRSALDAMLRGVEEAVEASEAAAGAG